MGTKKGGGQQTLESGGRAFWWGNVLSMGLSKAGVLGDSDAWAPFSFTTRDRGRPGRIIHRAQRKMKMVGG